MRRRFEPIEISDYRRHLSALARLVRRAQRREVSLAPVVSLAEARARRAGHPSVCRADPSEGGDARGAHVRVIQPG